VDDCTPSARVRPGQENFGAYDRARKSGVGRCGPAVWRNVVGHGEGVFFTEERLLFVPERILVPRIPTAGHPEGILFVPEGILFEEKLFRVTRIPTAGHPERILFEENLLPE
jgi:hypothetical protein